MKALTISEYGSSDNFQLSEVSKPRPASDDVVVEVRCASINPIDWKIRRGNLSFLLPRRFPRTLGIDVAGTVVEVGSAVKKFKVGDRVFGMADPFRNQYGSYAQFCLAQETKLALIPQSVSFEDAAVLPVAGLTAYKALFQLGSLDSGSHVLINGASGGVGSLAVQLAKIGGAKVTATCGPDNVDFVRSLGADEVLNYRLSDIGKLKDKFSILFDVSSKLSFFRIKQLLSDKGSYIGTNPTPDLILATAVSLPFSRQKAFLVMAGSGSNISQELTELANLVSSKKLRPIIAKSLSLSEVAAAHNEAESEHTRGKLLVCLS